MKAEGLFDNAVVSITVLSSLGSCEGEVINVSSRDHYVVQQKLPLRSRVDPGEEVLIQLFEDRVGDG